MRTRIPITTSVALILATIVRTSIGAEDGLLAEKDTKAKKASIPGCDDFESTPELWKQLDVDTWLAKQIQNITRVQGGTVNIANELFKTLAPSCPASQCHCDSFETCSFGSSLNIAATLSCDDKKRVFMALDSISNIATLFHQTDEVTERSMNELDRMQGQNLDIFTEKQHVDEAYKAHQKKLLLLSQFLLAFVAVAAGPLSSFINPLVSAITPDQANKAVAASLFGAYQGFIASGIDIKHPDKYYDSMDKEFKGVAVFLERALQQKVEDDGFRLLNGSDIGSTTLNLTNTIAGGAFLHRHSDDVPRMRRVMEKLFRGLTINYFWAIDRAYIVMANVKNGGCPYDVRGPSQVRVCLDEYPNKSFWVYHISLDKEFEGGVGQIKPLKGWHLLENSEKNSPYTAGLTQEDAVRSSLEWYEMHGHSSPSQVINDTETFLDSKHDFIGTFKTGKLLPGTFRIPVLKNLGGEAISSIFQNKGLNYPCMAGNFSSWASPGAEYPAGDELEAFLQATALYSSPDWARQCRTYNRCTQDRNRPMNFREEAFLKIPAITHAFKRCGLVVSHNRPFVGKNTDGYKDPVADA